MTTLIKFLDPTGCTEYEGKRFKYNLPRRGEKWARTDHPFPASNADGKDCGPGRIHAMKINSSEYAPDNWWPWHLKPAPGSLLVGESNEKAGYTAVLLAEIPPKLWWSFLRRFGKEAKLSGANLHLANLHLANLHWANLSRADLRGANLSWADLDGANLRGANLSVADLRGANLSGADLDGANLRGANLRGANLRGANLHLANLSWADLDGANLSGANLSGADLDGANLDEQNYNLIMEMQGKHV